MPLHTTNTAVVVKRDRLARIAAVAIAAATAATATVVMAAEEPVAQARTIAAANGPGPRYFDLEANKAAGMKALGRHLARQQPFGPGARYFDLEANKAA
jgi:hypothetical protein